MAHPIKLAQRTVIDPSFIAGVETVYSAFFDNIKQYTDGSTKAIRSALMQHPDAASRIVDFQKGVQEERRGTNYDIRTRIQTANQYVRMYSYESLSRTWLIGETKDIVISGHRRWNNKEDVVSQDYNLGPYDICIDGSALANLQLRFHLIPKCDPLTGCRHPHHYAIPGGNNPLDFVEHTCLGSFSTGMVAAKSALDIAGLFTNLYSYVGRYNASSPYRRLEDKGNFEWVH